MGYDYSEADYIWIRELMSYPDTLSDHLAFFDTTDDVAQPDDPIERVVFQDRAKSAIRKIAHNRGHMLMVGRPGTGKSMLAEMFQSVLDRSLGDYLRPSNAIVAYPGKSRHHIRLAYESPNTVEERITQISDAIETAAKNVPPFELSGPIRSVRRAKWALVGGAVAAAAAGLLWPAALIATGIAGIGAVFMFIQETNYRAQEKIQQDSQGPRQNAVKHLLDMVPEILFDPRRDHSLMARVAEPDARSMKGGFRHDPYQSGTLHTPAHKRAFLGAHAMAPILYLDELKTLIRAGYMPELLEVMQNKSYTLEGGRGTGSGAADRCDSPVRADNIIVACCNHDTLETLRREGDGAFLSRIEDKGEIIEMAGAVEETADTIRQVVQYLRQEIDSLDEEFQTVWGDILAAEGRDGVRRRCEQIMGATLPADYRLETRPFAKPAVMEIVKELRCRASDGRLSCILRPINGVIKTAEFLAIADNAETVTAENVRHALDEHLSLEGAMTREAIAQKRDLKKYITTMTDAVGYVVGLAVFDSGASGRKFGQPLPIHGQIHAGGSDRVTAPGKIGDIAKAAAQNVRASIKGAFQSIGAPYVGYEMHVEYIQAHGGVEGDSASVAMDIALISDYIKEPVNQTIGITGSLTGDIILPVGGVTEKIRAILDPSLGMTGACIPWQNKHDVQPLLINTPVDFIRVDDIPGLRIYRQGDGEAPFDVFFCKTKYHAYRILMGLGRAEITQRMVERSRSDFAALNSHRSSENTTPSGD